MNGAPKALAPLALVGLAVAACGPARPAPPTTAEADLAARSTWVPRVVRACARVASLAPEAAPPHVASPDACFAHLATRASNHELDCFEAATSAVAVARCLDDTSALRLDACPGQAPRCDGDVLERCPGQPGSRVDCRALGATCGRVERAGGLEELGCTSKELCPPNAPAARCDGEGAVLSCEDGLVERTPCRLGRRCRAHVEDGIALARCEPTGRPACRAPGAAVCDGDRLVECVTRGAHTEERVVDCARLGLACGAGGCVDPRPGRACLPGAARCEGDALVFCGGGAERRVPCPELGFATCSASGRGPRAACVP